MGLSTELAAPTSVGSDFSGSITSPGARRFRTYPSPTLDLIPIRSPSTPRAAAHSSEDDITKTMHTQPFIL